MITTKIVYNKKYNETRKETYINGEFFTDTVIKVHR